MIFNPEHGALIDFDVSTQTLLSEPAEMQLQDGFVFLPIAAESQIALARLAEQSAVAEMLEPIFSAEEKLLQPVVNLQPTAMQTATPQQIMTLSPQSLEGTWNVDRWEYWLRHSALSPALQELLQYGVMHGDIAGASVLRIPAQYQQLLSGLQGHLEQALKQQWAHNKLSIEYASLEEVTPAQLLQQRMQAAFARAEQMLQQEPMVQHLLSAFDGELHEIKFQS